VPEASTFGWTYEANSAYGVLGCVRGEIDIFQLDEIPMFNRDDEKFPPSSVVELKKRIRRAGIGTIHGFLASSQVSAS
jgi:hypothetical protein